MKRASLAFVLGQPKDAGLPLLPKAEDGMFYEIMPSLPGFLKDLSSIFKAHAGAALFIDYAHDAARRRGACRPSKTMKKWTRLPLWVRRI